MLRLSSFFAIKLPVPCIRMRSIRSSKYGGTATLVGQVPPITVKSALVDYLIDKAVFLCFLGGHKMITLAVGFDGLNALAGVPGKDLIERFLIFSICFLPGSVYQCTDPGCRRGLVDLISAFGRAIRLPFAPDERRNAPIEAPQGRHISWTHRA